MKSAVSVLAGVIICYYNVLGAYGAEGDPILVPFGGPKGSRLFGASMVEPSPPATATNATAVEMANFLIQNITGIKYGILTTVTNFLAPIMQSLLISSIILFALAGTGSIVCSMIDCFNGMGLNGGYQGIGHGPVLSTTAYHHQFQQPLNNPNLMSFLSRRKQDTQRKPWTMQEPNSHILNETME